MSGVLNMIVLYIVYLYLGMTSGIQLKIGDSKDFTWSYFVDESQEKLVAIQRSADDNTIADCYITGDSALVNEILEKTPETDHYTEDEDKLLSLINVCNQGKVKGIFTKGSAEDVVNKFGLFSGLFFYPGTKWCGAGNISESDDDIGSEAEADKCCRAHDHCKDTISAFGTKYGLENDSPITVSNCDCDDLFSKCLKEANTRASNRIGGIFFNVLPVKCFRQDYPIKTCKKYSGLARYICEEYELDFDKDETYEFFDHPHYDYSISDEDVDEDDIHDLFSYLLNLEHENMLYKLIEDS